MILQQRWRLGSCRPRQHSELFDPDIENRLLVAKRRGWVGSLGLADANDYI